jgi:hypothetical protein
MKDMKKLRVSYVGFFHETDTYLTEGMGETTLDRMRTFRGDQITKELKGTAIGGQWMSARKTAGSCSRVTCTI